MDDLMPNNDDPLRFFKYLLAKQPNNLVRGFTQYKDRWLYIAEHYSLDSRDTFDPKTTKYKQWIPDVKSNKLVLTRGDFNTYLDASYETEYNRVIALVNYQILTTQNSEDTQTFLNKLYSDLQMLLAMLSDYPEALKYSQNIEVLNKLLEFIDSIYSRLHISFTGELLEQIEDDELEKIRNSENKFWKGIPMAVVINHFSPLTQILNSNDALYLSNEQFVAFLKRGFLDDQLQGKQKLNVGTIDKGFVISLFYDFYNLAVAEYGHLARTAPFVNMFLNCFDNNWKESSVKSYFKGKKTKRNW